MVGALDPPPTTSWAILCNHVEKVKSFAPSVNHYVADVFLGDPAGLVHRDDLPPGSVGIVSVAGELVVVDLDVPVEAPSCALSKDGVLNQDWMMEESPEGGPGREIMH
jgi:hypothetical protein